ncbi:MAG: tRNA (adenine(22)-N(1))-methyltransferase [Eubacterium sp.]
MKWSKRLQTIMDEVTGGAVMADIGTDHAYLPIRLQKEGICPHVILCDVSRGSLKKAEKDWKAELPDAEPDLRLGDGLQVLKAGEAGSIVMAGIGGILIADILEYDLEKARTFPRFILQPRSNPGYLRWRLDCCGFQIVHERIAPEGRRLCEILVVSPLSEGTKNTAGNGILQGDSPAVKMPGLHAFQSLEPEVQAEYSYPDSLASGEPYMREYLEKELLKQEKILQNQKKSESSDSSETEAAVRRLQSLLEMQNPMK